MRQYLCKHSKLEVELQVEMLGLLVNAPETDQQEVNDEYADKVARRFSGAKAES
ncbi:hypothetical protein [Methylomonas sp. CM2]|uniref:hypothetical protein n=1 Tax=Methylomonas sp. CM2 TaxID=3417647 RepID=UPI003CF4E17E